MLLNLKTIHKPDTLDQAIALLDKSGTYPLYGGITLQRAANPDVEAVVHLDKLGLATVTEGDNALLFGSMLSLEQVRQACLDHDQYPTMRALAAILAAEQPETLRNTMTLGDLLVERDPQSLALTLFLTLGVMIHRADLEMQLTTAAWLSADEDVARYLITGISVPYGAARSAVAFEKVARTPTDAPIVGAVAYAELGDDGTPRYSTLALCGVAPTPVRQPDAARVLDESGDIDAALDHLDLDPPHDHWGSREYRAEMARVLSRRVLARAIDQAGA